MIETNPERGNPVKFNWDEFYRLVREEGYSEKEAMHIVATEMDGAYEKPSGNLDSWTTYCDELDYYEDLPDRDDLPDIHPADECDDYLF